MNITPTFIKDLFIIEPQVFGDERGFFMESYSKRKLKSHGLNYNFVQDNRSQSQKGVLRGMHYQVGEYAQAKLVEVIKGRVFDAVVDLRNFSPTYGKWFGVELSEENKKQLLVPRGFAHGFLVLEDDTIFSYKCDQYYNKDKEAGIPFDDDSIGIDWPPFENYILSEKDLKHPPFGKHQNAGINYV